MRQQKAHTVAFSMTRLPYDAACALGATLNRGSPARSRVGLRRGLVVLFAGLAFAAAGPIASTGLTRNYLYVLALDKNRLVI